MAYGKPQMRPQRSIKKLQAVKQPLTEKIQQGKQGTEGADDDAVPNFGVLPQSGNFAPNAGGPISKGGHSAGLSGAMKGAGGSKPYGGTAHAKEGPKPSHEQQKKPKHPGSHGGANTGSIDTMTKLFFHPKGGFDNKEPDTARHSKGAGGYKDSGKRGGPHKTGVYRGVHT